MSSNPIQQVHQIFTRHWATTDATIDSCSWVHDHDYTGVAAGHYDVFFSYRDKGNPDQLHHGRFCRNGSQRIAPYHPGERIPIRYSPKSPDRFYPVDATPGYEKIEAILVMTLFALIAGYLLFAF